MAKSIVPIDRDVITIGINHLYHNSSINISGSAAMPLFTIVNSHCISKQQPSKDIETFNQLFLLPKMILETISIFKQDCIPVGCVPPAH